MAKNCAKRMLIAWMNRFNKQQIIKKKKMFACTSDSIQLDYVIVANSLNLEGDQKERSFFFS